MQNCDSAWRAPQRHGRARPGHPRLQRCNAAKTWMPGTRHVVGPAFGRTRVPGMTNERHSLSTSWPGSSRPSTPSTLQSREDVDARHKAGHDDGEVGHKTRNVMAGFIPAIHVLDNARL